MISIDFHGFFLIYTKQHNTMVNEERKKISGEA
jgi:hypothetical protein